MAKVNKYGLTDAQWRKLPLKHREAIKNSPENCGHSISPKVLPRDWKVEKA